MLPHVPCTSTKVTDYQTLLTPISSQQFRLPTCRKQGSSSSSGRGGSAGKAQPADAPYSHAASLQRVAPAPGAVVLRDRICTGDAGTVVHAVYQGAPAVVKLFTPDSSAQAAYRRELQAYQRFQGQQGHLLPAMLGTGYLAPGVRFIALSGAFLQQRPGLPRIPTPVHPASLLARCRCAIP